MSRARRSFGAARVLAGAGGALGGLRHDPEELRQRARDLLSRPPYQPDAQGPIEHALMWVRDRIAQVLDAVLASLGQGTSVAWGVVAVGVLLLLVAAWYASRGFVVDRRSPVAEVAAPARSSGEWIAEAERHEAAGRWRAALRSRYGALVTLLVESATLDDEPGRTVREVTAAVAETAPDLHADVARAGERFEAVWYGNETATDDDVAIVATALDAVAAAARPTAVPM